MTPEDAIRHWVGTPWQRDGLHCWELTRRVQAEVFGRDLPIIQNAPEDRRDLLETFERHPERARWHIAPMPVHGAVVLMSRGDGRRDCHVGTYLAIDGGGVLHADERCGVMFEPPVLMSARGWRRLTYYTR